MLSVFHQRSVLQMADMLARLDAAAEELKYHTAVCRAVLKDLIAHCKDRRLSIVLLQVPSFSGSTL